MKDDCKATIQTFSDTFSEEIGCPFKYKTYKDNGKKLYD